MDTCDRKEKRHTREFFFRFDQQISGSSPLYRAGLTDARERQHRYREEHGGEQRQGRLAAGKEKKGLRNAARIASDEKVGSHTGRPASVYRVTQSFDDLFCGC